MRMTSKYYAVYDTQDKDIVLGIFRLSGLCKFLDVSKTTIYRCLQNNKLVKHRYEVVEIDDEDVN
nr:MAG TPA: MerR HTH family regulatory protein [Caudoviricetes sp.]